MTADEIDAGATRTAKVAVIAHRRKSLGGGLPELRRALGAAGITDPVWFEVPKSKKAPKQARQAVKEGAELILVWGGDGMVQRCIDALAGSDVHHRDHPGRHRQPAGHEPRHPPGPAARPLEIALGGRRPAPRRRASSTASTSRSWPAPGFDALMIHDADRGPKDQLGSLAYVWTGAARRCGPPPTRSTSLVDGVTWFEGQASCVLVGNVRTGPPAGSPPSTTPSPTTAGSTSAWSRPRAPCSGLGCCAGWRCSRGRPARRSCRPPRAAASTSASTSPCVYELDGGDRPPTDRLQFEVQAGGHHRPRARGTTA